MYKELCFAKEMLLSISKVVHECSGFRLSTDVSLSVQQVVGGRTTNVCVSVLFNSEAMGKCTQREKNVDV